MRIFTPCFVAFKKNQSPFSPLFVYPWKFAQSLPRPDPFTALARRVSEPGYLSGAGAVTLARLHLSLVIHAN